MRVRFALAAALTMLAVSPLGAQPFSSGSVKPGSWACAPPYRAGQAYYDGMAYGDGYGGCVGGVCSSCDSCDGSWHGFFGKCTTVNGCPYWTSDPCSRTIVSEMACDVRCWLSTMHCYNHSCLRSALCRALCQDCSLSGSCFSDGCSSCLEGGTPYGYDPKAGPAPPRDEQVDPFRDDMLPVPPQAQGGQHYPHRATARQTSAAESTETSVLRADYQEPYSAAKYNNTRPYIPRRHQSRAAAPPEDDSQALELQRQAQYQQAQRQQAMSQQREIQLLQAQARQLEAQAQQYQQAAQAMAAAAASQTAAAPQTAAPPAETSPYLLQPGDGTASMPPPPAPRVEEGGVVSRSSTSRTAGTGVDLQILGTR